MQSLGIYGPKQPDRSGIANYTQSLLPTLQSCLECVEISNNNWQAPHRFDYVLYNVGASKMHHGVFQAMQQRSGPAIIHENNILSYFYEAWNWLSVVEQQRFLRHAGTNLGADFLHLDDAVAYLDEHPLYDRYSADLQIEDLFMDDVTVALTHSESMKVSLLARYPNKPVLVIRQVASRLTQSMADWARTQLGLTNTAILFGTFGFIGEYKRLEKIFLAWSKWNSRPDTCYLLIVGERQYSIEIPPLPGLIYLDYVNSEADFDSYLAAVDCGVQLRYPTLGETSGVMTKLLANNKYLITSRTPYTQDYDSLEHVYRIPPDENEVIELIAAWEAVVRRPRRIQGYDVEHSPHRCATQLLSIILDDCSAPLNLDT